MVGWYVGAGINLVGSIAINLGTNVMKLGHNKRAMLDMPEEEKPAVTRFREWQIGTIVFIIGNIANFASFGFAAQSLLAALGSVQFVSNVFFASFVLKEKVTFLILAATACIIGGCLVLVIFGNHSSDDYTVDELLALYREPPYIVYLVMMFVFVFGSYVLYLHGKHVAGQKGRERSFWVAVLPVSYSIFSALLGTQSVLFSKSLSVLLRSTFSGDGQLGNWYTWVTLLCFLITAGFWVTRLNKGLRLFPAMIIVPLMQICWTLFSIISGMLYFQEYETFNPSTAKNGPLNAIMFAIGVLIVFVGVFLLTKSGRDKQSQELEAKQKELEEVDVLDNPAFDGGESTVHVDGHATLGTTPQSAASPTSIAQDPDIPQKHKLDMDTLRFTSLASSTAANIKSITKAKRAAMAHSPDGQKSDAAMMAALRTTELSSTMNTTQGRGGHIGLRNTLTPIHDSDEEDEDEFPTHNGGPGSMMGTLKKGAKKIHKRLRSDFNVDLEPFAQLVGLGKSTTGMPAMSMYMMPAVDLMSTTNPQKQHRRGKDSFLSALPQSRFFGKEAEHRTDDADTPDLERQSAPLLQGPGTSTASDYQTVPEATAYWGSQRSLYPGAFGMAPPSTALHESFSGPSGRGASRQRREEGREGGGKDVEADGIPIKSLGLEAHERLPPPEAQAKASPLGQGKLQPRQ